MTVKEATLSGTLKQAELAILNMIYEEIAHPFSRKRQQVIVPILYDYEDGSGERDRFEVLKLLKKEKVIHAFEVFTEYIYHEQEVFVRALSARINLTPIRVTRFRDKLIPEVRWEISKDKLIWRGLKLDKVTGRFEYGATSGRLSGKQKILLVTLLVKKRCSYKSLYNAMNPGKKQISQHQKQVGYTLRAIKLKLRINKRKNPEIFLNVNKWGYELK